MVPHPASPLYIGKRFFYRLYTKRYNSTVKFDESYVNVIPKHCGYNPKFERIDHLSQSLTATNDVGDSCDINGGKRLFLPSNILTELAKRAFTDIMYFLRPGHLAQLRKIYDDPESSDNDKFVSIQLLKNACIASARVLPGCQDTGTAIVIGYKGGSVMSINDHKSLAEGIYSAYAENKFRYSQMSALNMYKEVGTGCNLPAQIDIFAADGTSYDLLFIAKGGGSANKTFLYQETRAILDVNKLKGYLLEKISTIGTSACPPYHLVIVVGGLSAEMTLKTVKLASCKELDNLPIEGNRDVQLENELLRECQNLGIGAQFGGKYFCHDVRVVRLPRHGASCPIGIGVSCSADRQIKAKIDTTGVYIEKLEENPAQYLPDVQIEGNAVKIDLNRPISEILKALSELKVSSRVVLSGPLLVARDLAHQMLDNYLTEHGDLPEWFKQHPIYYAGPAKKPDQYASGSFGPTTAGRMDSYADRFMAKGASLISLAKGNRSRAFAKACKDHGGFYLGSVGGPAALIAKDCIKKMDVVAFPELGMEAVFKIEVDNFPAFVVVDCKGNDFYKKWTG